MVSRLQLSAVLLVAALVWAASLALAGVAVTPAWFTPFSRVLGVVVFLLSVSDRWLWRLRFLRPWLFNMPDLNGTWRTWIRPTAPSGSPAEVEAYMVIRQTFSSVSLRLFTAESQSETLAARVLHCEDGTCTLASTYRNVPRLSVRERSPLHHGALLLHVHGDPPPSLEGQYWTDRQSQGELRLEGRIGFLAHSFEEARQAMAGSGTERRRPRRRGRGDASTADSRKT